MTVTAKQTFELTTLETPFHGDLVLRFDYRRTVLVEVLLSGPGLSKPLTADRSSDAFDSFALDSDPFSFLFRAPSGEWPAGTYAAVVEYRGAPPTLDRLGILWRRLYPANALPQGRSSVVIEVPDLQSPRVRILAAESEAPGAALHPLTPSQWPIPMVDKGTLLARGPGDFRPPDGGDPSLLEGPLFVEIESTTPPGLTGSVRLDATQKFFLPPPEQESPSPDERTLADRSIAARRLAIRRLPMQLGPLHATTVSDVRDAMEFWIRVEVATNPDHGNVDSSTIDVLRGHLWKRMAARCLGKTAPAPLQQAEHETLEKLTLTAIGADVGAGGIASVLSNLNRLELRFGLFAAGQLAIYCWLGDDADRYFQFYSAGVADSAYFLLFGEAALYFGDADPRWLRLLPTFTWTAEIAMNHNWRGGQRRRASYTPEYAKHAFSQRAIDHRLTAMERTRRAWTKTPADWPAEFDRVCRRTLAHEQTSPQP